MKPYGFSRTDDETCPWGCCHSQKCANRLVRPGYRQFNSLATTRRARKHARQEAKRQLTEDVLEADEILHDAKLARENIHCDVCLDEGYTDTGGYCLCVAGEVTKSNDDLAYEKERNIQLKEIQRKIYGQELSAWEDKFWDEVDLLEM